MFSGLRLALYGGLLAALLLAGWRIYHAGVVTGEARTQAKWDANKADIQAVADKAIAAAHAKEQAAATHNAEVIRNANTELVAIAADRDSLVGRLRAARQASAGRCSVPEGPGIAGTAPAPQDSGDGSLDAAIGAALTEAKSNNVNHAALIEQIRPQL